MPNPVLEVLADASSTSLARSFKYGKPVVGMDLFEGGGLAQRFRRVAEGALLSRAVVKTAALGIDQRDHVGGVFRDNAEKFFALGEAAAEAEEAPLLKSEEKYERTEEVVGPQFHAAEVLLREKDRQIRRKS